MTYITIKQKQQECQISFEDILYNRVPVNMFNVADGKPGTFTRKVDTINKEVLGKVNINRMIKAFHDFNVKYDHLFKQERKSLYYTFYIPKKTGGMRKIDAPNDELKAALRELKDIMTNQCGLLHHTAAFAYVSKRSIVDAITKHQLNESNWFLKTDFSNFFPSISIEFAVRMMSMIFPISEIVKIPEGKKEFEIALSLGFMNNSLPQGTPFSPFLSNICMLPIDHAIFNYLANKRYVYTRYADDILISCVQSFDYKKVVSYIRSVLREFHAPFDIKDEKTRYGSRKGSNWNLGLMLNKDNNITLGYMKKKFFKASLNNYILDTLHNKPWDISDVLVLQGTISYFKMVERNYINYLIEHYNAKYNVNVENMIHNQIAGF